MSRYLQDSAVKDFCLFLQSEEKSSNTIEKYIRDINKFFCFCKNYTKVSPNQIAFSKTLVLAYKEMLINKSYKVTSINSMLISLNRFFDYLKWYELKIKTLKVQKQAFIPKERELNKDEYKRLIKTAKEINNFKLALIIETICATGIRISELKFITKEAVEKGEAVINCKGKIRTIILVKALRKKLHQYIKSEQIVSGSVFVTKNNKPINRTNIWREMKSLCKKARVNPKKVYPHNLRHLFARTYYNMEKDISKLADILGHSNINTTRIYTSISLAEHITKLEKLKLII